MDFLLNYDHNISYQDIHNMMPWEREVIISLIKQRKVEVDQQKARNK